MMPRTAIAQIAKMIGRELDAGAGPSEEALAAGPTLSPDPAVSSAALVAVSQRGRSLVFGAGIRRLDGEDTLVVAFAAAPICGHDRGPQLVVMRST